MKRTISLLLVAVMCLVMAGCRETNHTEESAHFDFTQEEFTTEIQKKLTDAGYDVTFISASDDEDGKSRYNHYGIIGKATALFGQTTLSIRNSTKTKFIESFVISSPPSEMQKADGGEERITNSDFVIITDLVVSAIDKNIDLKEFHNKFKLFDVGTKDIRGSIGSLYCSATESEATTSLVIFPNSNY